jgi:hypothetical protein
MLASYDATETTAALVRARVSAFHNSRKRASFGSPIYGRFPYDTGLENRKTEGKLLLLVSDASAMVAIGRLLR